VKDRLQEHVIAEKQTTNKQTKMIGNDNCEQNIRIAKQNIIIIALIQ
jgi:hypothetical protein